MTMDGKIAKNENHFPDWTSPEDKQLFAKISKEHKVIIMGEKTFDTFPSPLKERLSVVFTLNPDRPETENVKWVSGEPADIIKELEQMGYQSAILGGGATINSLFLENNLIDEIIVTIEPKIFGQGLSLFNKDKDINLELIETKKINDNSVVLHYKVIK